MQEFLARNTQKYAIGRQTDVCLVIGNAAATNGSYFLSMTQWEVDNAPDPIMFEDAEGNRTSNSYAQIGDRQFAISFGGSMDVNKVAKFLYLLGGKVTTTTDSNGGYQHVIQFVNNVILPPATAFYSLGAEGYKRLKGFHIMSMTINVGENEATFSGSALALEEDDLPNSSTQVDTLTVTDAAYQSNGLVRYTFSGSPDLSSVTNGDVLDLSAASGFANDEHEGKWLIVEVNDGSSYVDVINDNITDDSFDEAAITASGNQIYIVVEPSYPAPEAMLLRRHSSVKDAVNVAGLAAAPTYGLRNLQIEINNNSAVIQESDSSQFGLVIIAKNININASHTQIMKADSATKALGSRNGNIENRAFLYSLTDSSKTLASGSWNPKIDIQLPQNLAKYVAGNQLSTDELIYDVALNAQKENNAVITVRNTLSSVEA